MARNPGFVERPAIRLAGFHAKHPDTRFAKQSPNQWARLMGASPLPGQCNDVGYGVRYADQIDQPYLDYIAAVEVAADAPLLPGSTEVTLPAGSYAVFDGFEQLAELRAAWGWIAADWLPAAPFTVAPVPAFERYGEGFDPLLGRGDMSIWLPVIPRAR